MDKKEIEILLSYIKAAYNNKPISTEPQCTSSEDVKDLEEALRFVVNCISEMRAYIKEMSIGNLDTSPLRRENLFSGDLKELNAGLRHLVWQANQVAEGDYGQQINFLGEFSDSFNVMVEQLKSREESLKSKAESVAQTMDLITSVVDLMKDSLIVVERDTSKVIYANESAQQHFLNKNSTLCKERCKLIDRLISSAQGDGESQFEYTCDQKEHILQVHSYLIEWGDKLASAYLISDITEIRAQEEELETIAYVDSMTGLYSRRYCFDFISELIANKVPFSLCFVDIDKLKTVNDTYGHEAGDEYITTVARIMKENFRASDCLCRIGGDEIIVIYVSCPPDIAEKKMKIMREKIVAESGKYPMSISYGVVFVGSDTRMSMGEIVKLADNKMYDYKKKYSAPR